MMRRSRWGAGSCDCGCWLLLGAPPSRVFQPNCIRPLCNFPGSLSSPTVTSILVPVLAPVPAPVPIPILAPILSLVLIPVLVLRSALVPVPVTVSYLPSMMPCYPLGITSSCRCRVLRPKLLVTLGATSYLQRDDVACGSAWSSTLLLS